MNKTFWQVKLKNGVPFFNPLNGKEKADFEKNKMRYNEGDLLKITVEKVTDGIYDEQRKNAHYFAYLSSVLSNFDVTDNLLFGEFKINKSSVSGQVNELHEQLKARAIVAHPDLMRVVKDKDGNDTYHLFSLAVDKSPFSLKKKEREKYYQFAFDYLVAAQKQFGGWSISPYSEGIDE